MPARSRRARWRRVFTIASLSVLAVALNPSTAAAAPCWFPPVVGTVTDPFREPPCPWCAGNRGLEYRVAGRTVVRAAASGRVVFAGSVAGVRYVVVQLANGWRHTYGRLVSTPLELGDAVLANAIVGVGADTFFFGLRIGDDYSDPAPFIGVMRTRPRLVPIDATPPRPAAPARPRCQQPVSSPER
jgi:murein DD-endopeptidase MepM/ murein hydrolase activator NlpD